jgi:hypothetical protein
MEQSTRIRIAVVAALALAVCGCTHVATTQMANGTHCESTVTSYVFSANVESKCWDRNGNVLSSSQAQ